MDRPQEISRFAALAAVACLVNASATLLLMDFNLRAGAGSALGVAIVLGLVAWVVLARSLIARTILTIWLAFVTGAGIASYGVLLVQQRISVMSPTIHVLSLVTILANIFALYFLWTAPSTAWLERRADAS
jgi:hypothetical protein